MEDCAKLELFLDNDELSNISETVKTKIIEKLENLSQVIIEYRNEKLELTAVLGMCYSATNLTFFQYDLIFK